MMKLKVVSFGYKYDAPPKADVIIDTRSIYNPARIPDLYYRNGFDDLVIKDVHESALYAHVFTLGIASVCTASASNLDDFTVAFGCTAGKHRSVVLAEALAVEFKNDADIESVEITHREKKHWTQRETE